MKKQDLEQLLDRTAAEALAARRRIEAAVDTGELPVWLIETCNVWERAAMVYGAARATLNPEARAELTFDDLPLTGARGHRHSDRAKPLKN